MTIRVLLVEDQNSFMYSELLSAINGFEFNIVERGDHAVTAASEWLPDVIIMDIRLPMLNGIEAIRQIRRFDAHTPILVVTAYTDSDTLSKALAAGATRIYPKPFSYHKLKRAIHDLYVPRERRFQVDNERQRIIAKKTRLNILLQKQAVYGFSVPAEIVMEIDELSTEIEDLERSYKSG